ncbi:MAG TPA: bifunctional homocysteine S-methyltransferase/methylenetetrahydrofolate reductase [Chthoniobacterales bacterium]
MDLLDELKTSILCGDGAMGTELMDAGISIERCFEELVLSEPELVSGIHDKYLAAGARVIETNSFGANAVRLARFDFENQVAEINRTAAWLAKKAAKGKNAYVAGSVGPLGITADEAAAQGIDRRAVFQEQIAALLEGGVDLVMFETFRDLDELSIALNVQQSIASCTVVTSMVCTESGHLASGMSIVEAFRKLTAAGAEVVGLNCLTGPYAMLRALEKVPLDFILSAFPNAGYPLYRDGRYLYNTAPAYFAEAARDLAEQGARLIGGCCGVGPAQIAAMATTIKNLKPVTSKTVIRISEPPRPVEPVRIAGEPSLLDLIAQGKIVIVTELDPPKTLDLEKYFSAAKALSNAGSDAITLADNSLAILRVSNLAVGAMLKHRFGIMPLLHVSCRDRNLLGLQSELMGMSALGIRHVLPLTGDPARVGDHPGATSVFDVNSIELMKIVSRLNEGYNHAGKSIKIQTNFVIGCTFNPNAKSLDAQINRLERKIAAGAQYVMTQPVFDTRLVEEMARRTAHLKIPIFTGVWPLLSGRQTEFLHNEVPGIIIPDPVRASMEGMEGVEGRNKGVHLAKDIARAALDHFPGVYLITPFLAYDTTAELAAFVRGE